LKRPIATYISKESDDKISQYLSQHPETSKYKVTQQFIEEGVKNLGTNQNQNGHSNREVRPINQAQPARAGQTAKNPGTGELDE
jgi:hypothetical protein